MSGFRRILAVISILCASCYNATSILFPLPPTNEERELYHDLNRFQSIVENAIACHSQLEVFVRDGVPSKFIAEDALLDEPVFGLMLLVEGSRLMGIIDPKGELSSRLNADSEIPENLVNNLIARYGREYDFPYYTEVFSDNQAVASLCVYSVKSIVRLLKVVRFYRVHGFLKPCEYRCNDRSRWLKSYKIRLLQWIQNGGNIGDDLVQAMREMLEEKIRDTTLEVNKLKQIIDRTRPIKRAIIQANEITTNEDSFIPITFV